LELLQDLAGVVQEVAAFLRRLVQHGGASCAALGDMPLDVQVGLRCRLLAGGRRVDVCPKLLCCAVLCCAVLCCAVLCCAVLCCAVLCWPLPAGGVQQQRLRRKTIYVPCCHARGLLQPGRCRAPFAVYTLCQVEVTS
jgi:hypothetical protein